MPLHHVRPHLLRVVLRRHHARRVRDRQRRVVRNDPHHLVVLQTRPQTERRQLLAPDALHDRHTPATRHALARIHAQRHLRIPELAPQRLSHQRDVAGPAHDHHAVDVLRRHLRLAQQVAKCDDGLVNQRADGTLHLLPRDHQLVVVVVLGAQHVIQLREVDARLGGGGENDLFLLGHRLDLAVVACLLLLLHARAHQRRAELGFVLLHQQLHHTLVDVHTAEGVVSIAAQDDEFVVVDTQKGHIEGASSQVVHEDLLIHAVVLETVANGGCRGLIQRIDLLPCEARIDGGLQGGRFLICIEVRGCCDDCTRNCLSRIGFAHLIQHFLDDFSSHFRRGHPFAIVGHNELGNALVVNKGRTTVVVQFLDLTARIGSSDNSL